MRLRSEARREVRARLEWLRLLGVDELRCAGERSKAAPAAPGAEVAGIQGSIVNVPALPRTPESPGMAQAGLFGDTLLLPSAEARGGRKPKAGAEPGPPLRITGAGRMERPVSLEAIREEIGDCRRCRLSEGRSTIVFGVGSPTARLMFVGEGPGADEDRKGEPFVGRAGQLLTRIIESMGYSRQEVYIANIVKCRPPENRTPLPDEVATCSPFLFQQIGAIGPRVIVCLGTPAAQTLLGTRSTITHLRGNFREVQGIQIMPTFHPAYLLRNPAAKRDVWDDMQKVMSLLRAPG